MYIHNVLRLRLTCAIIELFTLYKIFNNDLSLLLHQWCFILTTSIHKLIWTVDTLTFYSSYIFLLHMDEEVHGILTFLCLHDKSSITKRHGKRHVCLDAIVLFSVSFECSFVCMETLAVLCVTWNEIAVGLSEVK